MSRELFLASALALAGCTQDSPPPPDPYSVLPGEWGWSGSDDCGSSPERIRFSEDRNTMFLSHAPARADGSREPHRTVTYDIVGRTGNRLGMALEGETGLDDSGKPVTWDLVLLGSSEYCWHRSDWPASGCTKSIVRCEN